ncbi:hypothetical protein [Streptomyces sp. BRA346]|uniref:hypothetical protein n=1 Tax=Streptomyces sp. BRA346 TaxID=2878199 RepID=UPI004063C368
MTARHPTPPPDMSGLNNDWKRLQDLRKDQPTANGYEDQDGDDAQEELKPRRAPRPGRSRGGRRPPPAAADAVPTTVRFDPEEASEVDFFILELREDARRRTLDKAEVIRELLRLAREHEPTKRALMRRLR